MFLTPGGILFNIGEKKKEMVIVLLCISKTQDCISFPRQAIIAHQSKPAIAAISTHTPERCSIAASY